MNDTKEQIAPVEESVEHISLEQESLSLDQAVAICKECAYGAPTEESFTNIVAALQAVVEALDDQDPTNDSNFSLIHDVFHRHHISFGMFARLNKFGLSLELIDDVYLLLFTKLNTAVLKLENVVAHQRQLVFEMAEMHTRWVLSKDAAGFTLLKNNFVLLKTAAKEGNEKSLQILLFVLDKIGELKDHRELPIDEQELTQLLSDNYLQLVKSRILPGVLTSRNRVLKTAAEQAVASTLSQRYQLNGERVLRSWTLSTFYSNLEPSLQLNLLRLELLREEDPHLPRFLQTMTGVTIVANYPLELLIHQQEILKQHMPYGVVISPRSDHNFAFRDGRAYLPLLEQLKEVNYGVRVIEASSPLEILLRLRQLDRRYGARHKISFCVLRGHGGLKDVTLGPLDYTPRRILAAGDEISDEMRQLFSGFIRKKALQIKTPIHHMVRSYFVDHPQLIFNSCNTGGEEGLAQEASQVYQARVTAIDRPSAIDEFTVTARENQPLLITTKYTEGEAVQYDRGTRVQ